LVQALCKEGEILLLIPPIGIGVELEGRPAVVASRHPEIYPTPGQLIQHGDVLCHPKWVPIGQNDATLTDPQLLGIGGQVGAYENRVCGSPKPAVPREVVLRNPGGGEAGVIQESDFLFKLVDQLFPFVWFGEMVVQGAVESHVHSLIQQALLLFT
jgi:hypothetical protein